ncbi:hypothetical protein [Nocardiopsis nanhaiensis]
MTNWTWEYLPDAEHVVGGLEPDAKEGVELLAQWLADAASVKHLGEPRVEDSEISRVLDHAEGRIMVWYQEHRRMCVVLILRVQFWLIENDS